MSRHMNGEPVAWGVVEDSTGDIVAVADSPKPGRAKAGYHRIPLYAHPPAHSVVTEAMVEAFIEAYDDLALVRNERGITYGEMVRAGLTAALTRLDENRSQP